MISISFNFGLKIVCFVNSLSIKINYLKYTYPKITGLEKARTLQASAYLRIVLLFEKWLRELLIKMRCKIVKKMFLAYFKLILTLASNGFV